MQCVPDELYQPAAVLPHRPQLLRQQAGLDYLQPELFRNRTCRRAPPLGLYLPCPYALELCSELAALRGEDPTALCALYSLGFGVRGAQEVAAAVIASAAAVPAAAVFVAFYANFMDNCLPT